MTTRELFMACGPGNVLRVDGRAIELYARPESTIDEVPVGSRTHVPWCGWFEGWDVVTGVRVRELVDEDDLLGIKVLS